MLKNIKKAVKKVKKYLKKNNSFYCKNSDLFLNINNPKILMKKNVNLIKSSGYVLDTLESCIWSILNNDNYLDTVLTAVNLGNDTDTITAITSSIISFKYDIKDIPNQYIETLRNKEKLTKIANKTYDFWNKM